MPYRAASSVVAPPGRREARVFRPGLAVLLSLGLCLLAGCGQRGPLVLPGAKPATAAPPASSPSAAAAAAPAR